MSSPTTITTIPSKEERRSIAQDAAGVGNLTKLHEYSVESVAVEVNEVEEWKLKRSMEIQMLKSTFFKAINEAAAMGLMKRLEPHEIISNDHVQEEEPKPNPKPKPVSKQRHKRKSKRASNLTEAHLQQSKQNKLQSWSTPEANLEIMEQQEIDMETQHPEDFLPSPIVPSFKKKTYIVSRQKLVDRLGQEVAEEAHERFWRIEKSKTLQLTQRCNCKYCIHPTPKQTQAYAQLRTQQLLSTEKEKQQDVDKPLPTLQVPVFKPNSSDSPRHVMNQVCQQVAVKAWDRQLHLSKKAILPQVTERCKCTYCQGSPSALQTQKYKDLVLNSPREDLHYKSIKVLSPPSPRQKAKTVKKSSVLQIPTLSSPTTRFSSAAKPKRPSSTTTPHNLLLGSATHHTTPKKSSPRFSATTTAKNKNMLGSVSAHSDSQAAPAFCSPLSSRQRFAATGKVQKPKDETVQAQEAAPKQADKEELGSDSFHQDATRSHEEEGLLMGSESSFHQYANSQEEHEEQPLGSESFHNYIQSQSSGSFGSIQEEEEGDDKQQQTTSSKPAELPPFISPLSSRQGFISTKNSKKIPTKTEAEQVNQDGDAEEDQCDDDQEQLGSESYHQYLRHSSHSYASSNHTPDDDGDLLGSESFHRYETTQDVEATTATMTTTSNDGNFNEESDSSRPPQQEKEQQEPVLEPTLRGSIIPEKVDPSEIPSWVSPRGGNLGKTKDTQTHRLSAPLPTPLPLDSSIPSDCEEEELNDNKSSSSLRLGGGSFASSSFSSLPGSLDDDNDPEEPTIPSQIEQGTTSVDDVSKNIVQTMTSTTTTPDEEDPKVGAESSATVAPASTDGKAALRKANPKTKKRMPCKSNSTSVIPILKKKQQQEEATASSSTMESSAPPESVPTSGTRALRKGKRRKTPSKRRSTTAIPTLPKQPVGPVPPDATSPTATTTASTQTEPQQEAKPPPPTSSPYLQSPRTPAALETVPERKRVKTPKSAGTSKKPMPKGSPRKTPKSKSASLPAGAARSSTSKAPALPLLELLESAMPERGGTITPKSERRFVKTPKSETQSPKRKSTRSSSTPKTRTTSPKRKSTKLAATLKSDTTTTPKQRKSTTSSTRERSKSPRKGSTARTKSPKSASSKKKNPLLSPITGGTKPRKQKCSSLTEGKTTSSKSGTSTKQKSLSVPSTEEERNHVSPKPAMPNNHMEDDTPKSTSSRLSQRSASSSPRSSLVTMTGHIVPLPSPVEAALSPRLSTTLSTPKLDGDVDEEEILLQEVFGGDADEEQGFPTALPF